MDLHTALDWVATKQHAVLITIRADGRPQSSDINYTTTDRSISISVTDSRAKTRNMRRDNRVVLHVSDPATWSYVSLDGTVALTPVAGSVDDDTVDQLVEHYRMARGEHPDWAEYRQAMVDDKRLLARFTPISAVGGINV